MTFLDLIASDKNRVQLQDAVTQVSQTIVKQIAETLVPAISAAAKDVVGAITVTVGPITIEPIKITVGVEKE